MRLRGGVLFLALVFLVPLRSASAETIVLKLEQKPGMLTYYISAADSESGADSLLVDTGSSFVVYTEEMFSRLPKDRYEPSGEVRGTLANGHEMAVSRYLLRSFVLGDCVFPKVVIAVIPGMVRGILGVGILKPYKARIDFVDDTLTLECPAKRPKKDILSKTE